MSQSILSGLLGSLLLLTGSLAAQPVDAEDLFNKQLNSSCEQGFRMQKQVEDLNQPQASPDTKLLAHQAQADDCPLRDELVYAFQVYSQDSRVEEYFSFSQKEDTLIARIKPNQASATPLKLQKLVFSADSSRLLFVESHLQRSYWLYQSDARTRVAFDAKGQYLRHWVYSNTQVSLLNKDLKVRVQGERE
jgi:hypothetical protein